MPDALDGEHASNPQGGERWTIWRCAGDCGTYSTDPRAISHAANCGKRFGPHERIEVVPAADRDTLRAEVKRLREALDRVALFAEAVAREALTQETGGDE